MTSHLRTLSLVTLALVGGRAVVAQQYGGGFTAAALAYSKWRDINDAQPEEILIAGSTGTTSGSFTGPATTTNGNNPLYTLPAIFATAGADLPDLLARLDIDGMTIGQDNLPILASTGVVDPSRGTQGVGGWAVLGFSIGTSGLAVPGSPLATAMAGLGAFEAGNAHFLYGLPGSTQIDDQLIGNVLVNRTADQIDTAPANSWQLDAIDGALPTFAANGGVRQTVFFPFDQSHFYFSLTPESVARLKPALFSTCFDNVPQIDQHEATVFYSRFENGAWTKPEVKFSRFDLGLDSENLNSEPDIDALSFDAAAGILLFSLADPLDEQLLVSTGSGALPLPLKDLNDKRVSEGIGLAEAGSLGTTNIDGLCGRDPDAADVAPLLGAPWGFPGHQLHLSVAATVTHSAPDFGGYTLAVSGWAAGAPAGNLHLYLEPKHSDTAPYVATVPPAFAVVPRAAGQMTVFESWTAPVTRAGGSPWVFWAVFVPNGNPGNAQATYASVINL